MKYDFPNDRGELLSGNLELPASEPRAMALFAHCFTCSKDSAAASSIGTALAASGIGVLRFDFTGLGDSQGEFANTNFSSNVQDLISACNHLAKTHAAPQLLIGHSLGGAAVLQAAAKLKQVRAVVTIGAPSSLDHLDTVLAGTRRTVEQNGAAEISLSGRRFTITRQFIDDMEHTEVLAGIERLRKALLVMHAPLDNTVPVDHAATIFMAAKHPKSFITLDNADHLLSRRRDGEYAARVIAAWADRYLSTDAPERQVVPEGAVLVTSRKKARFTQDIHTPDHHVLADEPAHLGGDNLGMSPYGYLLAGLGACTSMTLQMYAERKKLPLEAVRVLLKHEKIHADDCQECETKQGKIDRIVKAIEIEGPLSGEQRQRLLEIAEKCPVNRTLKGEIKIETEHR